MGEKYCKKCSTTKPITEFTKHNKTYDGFYYCCKECKNKNRSYSKDAKRNNEDPEKVRARRIRFQEKNPNYYRIKAMEWYRLNPEKVRASKKKRILNGKNAQDTQRRRAAFLNLPRDFTNQDWVNALEFFSNSCAYCGDSHSHLQMDHVLPLSKGGAFTADNIIPACGPCNSSKNNKDMLNWFSQKPFFTERRYELIIHWLNETALRNGNKLSDTMVHADLKSGGIK